MTRRRAMFSISAFFAVLGLLILANFVYGWWGWGKEKPCSGSHVQGSLKIMENNPVVLLGDLLEMKATLSFCANNVFVYREEFENIDVEPFDFVSRSQVKARKREGFTEWETRYTIQALNTIPGRNWSISSSLTYEVAHLPETYALKSNEVFVASLLSSDIAGIRGLKTDRVEESETKNIWGIGAFLFGGFLIASSFLFALRFIIRARKHEKDMKVQGKENALRFATWWDSLRTRDALQILYFTLHAAFKEDISQATRDDIERAMAFCEEAFNPDCDVAKTRNNLKELAERLAPLIMQGGR